MLRIGLKQKNKTEETKMTLASIGFWITTYGNYLSHSKGLNEEQISFLHSLKVGDQLVLWKKDENPVGEKPADLKLKLAFAKKEDR